MQIEIEPIAGSEHITSVSFTGRIDAYTVDRIEEELNSLVRIGSANLIGNLSGVSFISSSGFKAFRRIVSFAREQGGDLKFCHLSSEVDRLFKTVRFANEVDVFDEVKGALAEFESPSDKKTGRDSSQAGLKTKFAGILNSVGFSIDHEESEQEEVELEPQDLQQTQIFTNQSERSLQITVLFTSTRSASVKVGDQRHPKVEPVVIELCPDSAHLQNFSQLLGSIGTLVGFSSIELVKFNVVVSEVGRCLESELNDDETFAVKIDSRPPGFRVSIDIPRDDFDIYQKLKPRTVGKKLSPEEVREWVFNYVDKVDPASSPNGTLYRLEIEG